MIGEVLFVGAELNISEMSSVICLFKPVAEAF
jgi:hypothetical protein